MEKLLVVDDNENLRELYEMELSEEGYDVGLAESGLKALEYMRDHKPDLVVLDVAMPEMDGIRCMQEIRKIHPSLPIVLHTAFAQYKDHELTWSANAYVVKSGDLSELKERIRELLHVFQATA